MIGRVAFVFVCVGLANFALLANCSYENYGQQQFAEQQFIEQQRIRAQKGAQTDEWAQFSPTQFSPPKQMFGQNPNNPNTFMGNPAPTSGNDPYERRYPGEGFSRQGGVPQGVSNYQGPQPPVGYPGSPQQFSQFSPFPFDKQPPYKSTSAEQGPYPINGQPPRISPQIPNQFVQQGEQMMNNMQQGGYLTNGQPPRIPPLQMPNQFVQQVQQQGEQMMNKMQQSGYPINGQPPRVPSGQLPNQFMQQQGGQPKNNMQQSTTNDIFASNTGNGKNSNSAPGASVFDIEEETATHRFISRDDIMGSRERTAVIDIWEQVGHADGQVPPARMVKLVSEANVKYQVDIQTLNQDIKLIMKVVRKATTNCQLETWNQVYMLTRAITGKNASNLSEAVLGKRLYGSLMKMSKSLLQCLSNNWYDEVRETTGADERLRWWSNAIMRGFKSSQFANLRHNHEEVLVGSTHHLLKLRPQVGTSLDELCSYVVERFRVVGQAMQFYHRRSFPKVEWYHMTLSTAGLEYDFCTRYLGNERTDLMNAVMNPTGFARKVQVLLDFLGDL